jgi:hypothetical protein
MKAVIFAGPSLPPAFRPADSACRWRSPIRQGEIYQAARAGAAIIGILDGYFEVTPTVWHKEILWAMAQGIHVYGSASIGALRAAELHTFGMVGIGHIFAAYRDGVLVDDDEVAVLHGPEELGYPAVSEAMVNIRATLERTLSEGIIDRSLAADLTAIAKSQFYKERSWDSILTAAGRRGAPTMALDGFAVWLRAGRVDQKRVDALDMVAAIRVHLTAGVMPLKVSYRFQDTGYHRAAARQSM